MVGGLSAGDCRIPDLLLIQPAGTARTGLSHERLCRTFRTVPQSPPPAPMVGTVGTAPRRGRGPTHPTRGTPAFGARGAQAQPATGVTTPVAITKCGAEPSRRRGQRRRPAPPPDDECAVPLGVPTDARRQGCPSWRPIRLRGHRHRGRRPPATSPAPRGTWRRCRRRDRGTARVVPAHRAAVLELPLRARVDSRMARRSASLRARTTSIGSSPMESPSATSPMLISVRSWPNSQVRLTSRSHRRS